MLKDLEAREKVLCLAYLKGTVAGGRKPGKEWKVWKREALGCQQGLKVRQQGHLIFQR